MSASDAELLASKPRMHFSRPLGRVSPNARPADPLAYEKMLPPPKKAFHSINTSSPPSSAQTPDTAASDSMEAQMRPTIRYDQYNTDESPMKPLSPVSHNASVLASPDGAKLRSPASDTSSGRRSYFSSHIPTFRSSTGSDKERATSPLAGRSIDCNTKRDTYDSVSSDRAPSAPPKDPQAKPVDREKSRPGDSPGLVPGKIKKLSLAERAAKFGQTLASERPAKKSPAPLSLTSVSSNKYSAVKHVPHSGLPAENDSEMSLIKDTRSRTPSPVSALRSADCLGDGSNKPKRTGEMTVSPPQPSPPPPRLPSLYLDYRPTTTTTTTTTTTRTINRKCVPVRAPVADLAQELPANSDGEVTPRFVPYRSAATREPDDVHLASTAGPEPAQECATVTAVEKPDPDVSRPEREDTNTSRFSWTTVNTTTTYQQDSPPGSPSGVPRLPEMPARLTVNPVRYASLQKRLPTPPTSGSEDVGGDKGSAEHAKAKQALSHIDSLTLRGETVARRRLNMKRAMNELEKIDNASPLDVDLKTRRANQKKLKEHQNALREVEREEHEIGMALVRARRREDKERGSETSIWVRRVTR